MTLRWMVINIVNFACQEGAPNANHYFNQFQPQRLFHNDKIVVECQCHMFVLLLHWLKCKIQLRQSMCIFLFLFTDKTIVSSKMFQSIWILIFMENHFAVLLHPIRNIMSANFNEYLTVRMPTWISTMGQSLSINYKSIVLYVLSFKKVFLGVLFECFWAMNLRL